MSWKSASGTMIRPLIPKRRRRRLGSELAPQGRTPRPGGEPLPSRWLTPDVSLRTFVKLSNDLVAGLLYFRAVGDFLELFEVRVELRQRFLQFPLPDVKIAKGNSGPTQLRLESPVTCVRFCSDFSYCPARISAMPDEVVRKGCVRLEFGASAKNLTSIAKNDSQVTTRQDDPATPGGGLMLASASST